MCQTTIFDDGVEFCVCTMDGMDHKIGLMRSSFENSHVYTSSPNPASCVYDISCATVHSCDTAHTEQIALSIHAQALAHLITQ